VPVQFGAGHFCRRPGGFADARAFLPGRLVRTPGLPEGPGRFTARAGRPVSLRIDPLDLRRPVATARRLFDLRILLTGLPRGLRALPGAASCLERLNRFPGTHLRLRYRPLTCAVMTPA
jgi:hypothetical protein